MSNKHKQRFIQRPGQDGTLTIAATDNIDLLDDAVKEDDEVVEEIVDEESNVNNTVNTEENIEEEQTQEKEEIVVQEEKKDDDVPKPVIHPIPGKQLVLTNTPIYRTADSEIPMKIISGIVYFYDTSILNGRAKVTAVYHDFKKEAKNPNMILGYIDV